MIRPTPSKRFRVIRKHLEGKEFKLTWRAYSAINHSEVKIDRLEFTGMCFLVEYSSHHDEFYMDIMSDTVRCFFWKAVTELVKQKLRYVNMDQFDIRLIDRIYHGPLSNYLGL